MLIVLTIKRNKKVKPIYFLQTVLKRSNGNLPTLGDASAV